MLSYMLPATGDKPPLDETTENCSRISLSRVQNNGEQIMRNGLSTSGVPRRIADGNRLPLNNTGISLSTATTTTRTASSTTNPMTMITTTIPSRIDDDTTRDNRYHHSEMINESPKHNGTTITTTTRKSTLHSSRVTKDDSLHSINSEASTVGSERKSKIVNGGKHASLKRVSFGSSKGSMVETLVYETPVQEEPEINHFHEHNGRLPIVPVPDTDEGREKVRVAFLGPQPHPATPGVLLLEPLIPTGHLIDIMSTGPAELLTTHTEHTSPAYHAQISTDSGWDNPFRPDGDLSREADEIVELIKGGKPITPTPGQIAPPLPGCDDKTIVDDHDSSTRPLLNSNTSPLTTTTNQGNGNSHGAAVNSNINKQPVNEKVGSATSTATVEVTRVTAQGPGDASQVEHVTLKKKPKCKCCVLQ